MLLGVGAGLLCGLAAVLRGGASPGARSLAVLAGCVLGSLLAWATGTLLGPPPLSEQVAADPGSAPTSPLTVHALGALVVWPVVAAVVATAGYLAVVWSQRPPVAPDVVLLPALLPVRLCLPPPGR